MELGYESSTSYSSFLIKLFLCCKWWILFSCHLSILSLCLEISSFSFNVMAKVDFPAEHLLGTSKSCMVDFGILDWVNLLLELPKFLTEEGCLFLSSGALKLYCLCSTIVFPSIIFFCLRNASEVEKKIIDSFVHQNIGNGHLFSNFKLIGKCII